MSKFILRVIRIIKQPYRIIWFLVVHNIIKLSDEKFLKLSFLCRLGYKLNLDNPKTFNEKIQWLKLNDRKEIYTTMVDKYAVKDYVAQIIGKEYLIPTLGIYDKFEEIDFDSLPNQFVIKCTHDSGGLVICKDKNKLNLKETKKIINKSLKKNYYYLGREWPYKNVKPRILVEKYMSDKSGEDIKDYKFFCFNGKVEMFKIDFDRFINHNANYYNSKLKILPFGEMICPPNFKKKLEFPKNINKMIELANVLSENIPFVRVDFYNIDNHIYFGELTFYPASGFGEFTDKKWDYKLGNLISLNLVNKNEK